MHRLGDRDAAARGDHGLGLPGARRQGGDGGATTPRGGTATFVCAVAPESVVAVMVAVTGRGVVLVSTRAPGDTPDAVD